MPYCLEYTLKIVNTYLSFVFTCYQQYVVETHMLNGIYFVSYLIGIQGSALYLIAHGKAAVRALIGT